jgi:hypothetical protein
MERDTSSWHSQGLGARFNVIAASGDEEDGLTVLDTLASAGGPLPMQVRHPRQAGHEGWLWRNAGRG